MYNESFFLHAHVSATNLVIKDVKDYKKEGPHEPIVLFSEVINT